MSAARIDDDTLSVMLLRMGAVALNQIAPGVVVATEVGIPLVSLVAKWIREKEVLLASQLLLRLSATWERISLKRRQRKYLSSESAKRFVKLVQDVIRFELERQNSRLPNPLSLEKKRLKDEVEAMTKLKFERSDA